MSNIVKNIEYLKTSINNTISDYKNSSDINDFLYLKSEINYILDIQIKHNDLSLIESERFYKFINTLQKLFEKYLIDAFDYYKDIIRIQYESDVHSKNVKKIREKNKRKRQIINGKF